MFEKILVAIDGSSQSGKTVKTGIEMARRFGASVTVLHVREHGRYEASDVDLGPPGDPQALLDGGFSEPDIRKVMGGNVLRVLRAGIAPL